MLLHLEVKAGRKQNLWLEQGENNRPVVHIKAPAQEGKANEALKKFLAEHFQVPASKVTILKGQLSPFKTVSIEKD